MYSAKVPSAIRGWRGAPEEELRTLTGPVARESARANVWQPCPLVIMCLRLISTPAILPRLCLPFSPFSPFLISLIWSLSFSSFISPFTLLSASLHFPQPPEWKLYENEVARCQYTDPHLHIRHLSPPFSSVEAPSQS